MYSLQRDKVVEIYKDVLMYTQYIVYTVYTVYTQGVKVVSRQTNIYICVQVQFIERQSSRDRQRCTYIYEYVCIVYREIKQQRQTKMYKYVYLRSLQSDKVEEINKDVHMPSMNNVYNMQLQGDKALCFLRLS